MKKQKSRKERGNQVVYGVLSRKVEKVSELFADGNLIPVFERKGRRDFVFDIHVFPLGRKASVIIIQRLFRREKTEISSAAA